MTDWNVTPRAARRLRTFGRPLAPDERGHMSIWDRRKRPKPDPDAVDIELEASHAWWAQRENLELLVNPKKRGAEARARRAAEAAFAPPSRAGADRRASPTTATTASGSSWDPSEVYSWTSVPTSEAPPEPPAPTAPKTPWDVLGLTSDATWNEVAHRHKQLAKQHHPDRHGAASPEARRTAEGLMSEINAALSDLRRIYQLTDGT